MNKKISISGIGLLAFILGLCAAPESIARDRGNALQMAQMQTIANLNNQRAQLDTRISTALGSNQLTNIQADSLRAQLTQNSSLQTGFLADGLIDVSETQSVISGLNAVDSSLQSSIQSYNTTQAAAAQVNYTNSFNNNTPFNNNSRWGNRWTNNWGNRYNTLLNDLNNIQASISSQIASGQQSGRLTSSEYRSLKSELDRLSAKNLQIANSRGRAVISERQNLMDRFNALQTRVTKELNDRDRIASNRFNNLNWSWNRNWR